MLFGKYKAEVTMGILLCFGDFFYLLVTDKDGFE